MCFWSLLTPPTRRPAAACRLVSVRIDQSVMWLLCSTYIIMSRAAGRVQEGGKRYRTHYNRTKVLCLCIMSFWWPKQVKVVWRRHLSAVSCLAPRRPVLLLLSHSLWWIVLPPPPANCNEAERIELALTFVPPLVSRNTPHLRPLRCTVLPSHPSARTLLCRAAAALYCLYAVCLYHTGHCVLCHLQSLCPPAISYLWRSGHLVTW